MSSLLSLTVVVDDSDASQETRDPSESTSSTPRPSPREASLTPKPVAPTTSTVVLAAISQDDAITVASAQSSKGSSSTTAPSTPQTLPASTTAREVRLYSLIT